MADSEKITDEWILNKLAQSFTSMTDHAERTSLAYRLFGRRGMDVLVYLESRR
jgi:hypothetical protein